MSKTNEEIGFKISVDQGNANKSVSEFKAELKAANEEAIRIAETFGEFSPEAIEAAKSLEGLKEQFKSVSALAENLSGNVDVKINVDEAAASVELSDFKKELETDDVNVKLNVDAEPAIKTIESFNNSIPTDAVNVTLNVDDANAIQTVENFGKKLPTEDVSIKLNVDAAPAIKAVADFNKNLPKGNVDVKLDVDGEPAVKSVKSFKQELKEAKAEAIQMGREFGEFSPQALAAAKALGHLKDEFQDVNTLADNLTQEKRFSAFAGFAGSIAGGFAAAQGAIGLCSGESKEFEAVLKNVQSAMALSQGLSAVADLGRKWNEAKAALQSFTLIQKLNEAGTKAAAVVQKLFTGAVDTTTSGFGKLKVAIISTGIGVLAIAVGYVVANFEKLKEMVLNLIPGLGAVADFIGNIIDAVTDFVGITSDATRAVDKHRAAIIEQNEATDKGIQLLQASGATSKEVRIAKNQMYEDELNHLRAILSLQGHLGDDDNKRFKELKFNQALLKFEQIKADKDAAADAKKKSEEETKKAVEAAKEKGKKIAEEVKKNREKEDKANEDRYNEIQKQYEDDTQHAIDALNEKHAFEIALLEAQGQETKDIRNRQIDDEITLLEESGGKFLDGIKKLEEEKVIAAAQARTDAEAAQKEIDDKHKEDEADVEAQLKEDADALKADNEAAELEAIEDKYKKMREVVKGNEELTTAIVAAEAQAKANVEKKFDDIRLEQKRTNIAMLGSLLSGASNLIGKNTAVGKGLAVAEAVVQTYLGATKALSASSSIPIVGTALGIANAALIVASGIKSVTTILKTKVPGQGDAAAPAMGAVGGGSSPAVSTAPTMDGIQSTLLDQTKQLTEGKDSLKAYVVESEITQKQERANAITQTANF